MPGGPLVVVAAVGFLTTLVAGTAYVFRHLPRVYPRARTRLDPGSYRVVRAAVSAGVVVGAGGTVATVVDDAGTVRALDATSPGLLAGLAILSPGWIGPAMVRIGVGLLVLAALLAGVVELRAARE